MVSPLAIAATILYVTLVYSEIQSVPSMVGVYRFYRSLYVIIAASVLSFSGSVLQMALRNPLVDHYVLGVGSGALFATYLSITVLGYNPFFVVLSSIAGGLLALALTITLAEKISGSDVAYVLAGISVTTLFSGLSLFAYYYVVARYPFAGLLLVGSFVHARPSLIYYVVVPVVISCFGYVYLSKKLNTLVLGDDYAAQLGVNPRHTRLISSLLAGAASSIIVGLFGTIGFIGLVAPHIARFLVKTSDSRYVVPVSATNGIILLYAADLTSRYIVAPVWGEIPAGTLVSAIGAPFFIFLLIARFGRGRL